ncbi:oxidoreductase [Penicillium malachiteum]|uniref:oxidoreductase n=1 Tax=Penicillium malachiteum TaxID=1324776 RepID=UPI00254854D7|nr:oxidoreductase [Penicillium malachiteum]KAJ5729826.1 oxidoreductase [Penicillium malachiteum]
MRLSVPRHAARRALGEPLYSGNQLARSSYAPSFTRPELLSPSARPCYQHSIQSSRHISSNATASKPEGTHTTPKTQPNPSSEPNTQSRISPPSSISEHVRLLMRRVPYPVAIITSTDPSGPHDTSSFRGMTVSSFNTVTLSPHPVISFNVRRPSETLNALLASRRFLVHLLAPSAATATLARDFSKGNTTLAGMLSGHGDFEFGALDVSKVDSESDITSDENPLPLPILRRRETSRKPDADADFPFILECTLHPHKIDVHDHSIILGTVVRAIEGLGVPSVQSGQESPDSLSLTYANTKFWKMGREI